MRRRGHRVRARGPSAWAALRAQNPNGNLRQLLHALLAPGDSGGRLHDLIDKCMASSVLIAVVAVVLESVASLQTRWAVAFAAIDALAVAVFSLEYLMRLYACPEEHPEQLPWRSRLRAALRPAMLIDLLAIVPFFVEAYFEHLVDLRFLRVFRLLRLVKLTRYTSATQTLLAALKSEWPMMVTSAFIMMLLVIVAASLGYLFEHEAQPDKFENIPQAIYWAVITLASVGYGDIVPITPIGRAVTVVLALLGIGIFAVPAAVLSTAFNEQLRRDHDALHSELFNMLEDGVIDESEQQQIDQVAARLRLSEAEVAIFIARARHRRREADGDGGGNSTLPWALIEREPVVAREQYRALVGQLRQISVLTRPEVLQSMVSRDGTELETKICGLLIDAQLPTDDSMPSGGSGTGASGDSRVA